MGLELLDACRLAGMEGSGSARVPAVHRAYDAAVSFFEPPRPTARISRAVAVSPPAWLGPPHNVLPGIAPVELVIARTEETVVAIGGIHAYPEGFGFTLSLRLRNLSAREEQFPYLIDRAVYEGDALPDEFLRFGVQFADGRKATNLNLDPPAHDPEGPAPDRPVLIQQGGGGGGAAWDMEHWVWPLPPAGPFAFGCAWPSRAIGESPAEIDASVILEASGRAVTLWPYHQLGA
jgi:hypothetical protein